MMEKIETKKSIILLDKGKCKSCLQKNRPEHERRFYMMNYLRKWLG
jgi:hypothetical protein